MDTSRNSTENENTYVIDTESGTELVRIIKQDTLVTKAIGSLLPKQADPTAVSSVLDVACGPGSWTLDVAYEYPKIQVTGIDISRNSIDYAQARARSQGLDDNTHFIVMDATKKLAFPDESFDMVNCRFLVGFMKREEWPNLLRECIRVTRPGGFIRLTECDNIGISNSLAFERLTGLAGRAFVQAGYSFSPDGRGAGVTPMLAKFVTDAGYQLVDTIPHVIDCSAGTQAHADMYENWMALFKLLQPWVVKVGAATLEEAEELYHQALIDIMSSDFRALWYFLSVVGQKPT